MQKDCDLLNKCGQIVPRNTNALQSFWIKSRYTTVTHLFLKKKKKTGLTSNAWIVYLAVGSQSTSETLMQTFTQFKGQSKLQQHNELHDQIYGSLGDIAWLYLATTTRQIHGAAAPSTGVSEHCCSGAETPHNDTCLRDECTVYRVELPPNVNYSLQFKLTTAREQIRFLSKLRYNAAIH